MSVNLSDTLPAAPSGYTNVKWQKDASGAVSAYTANGKYATSWSSQTSVTVTHSLGTTNVIVQVYDTSNVLVIPESVTTTSTSVVTLTFGASFSGRVVVIA